MYKLVKWGRDHGKYNHAEFICDSEDDIAQIDMSPCAPGSIIYCISSDDQKVLKKYILTPSRNVVEFSTGSGSSGDNVDFATVSETSSYLNI